MMNRLLTKDEGFSLTEMLVVIVVIGILVLLALPKFSSVVTKAKETEAKIQLQTLKTLQDTYYYERDVYADNIEDIGFEQVKLITDGGKARYKIEIVKANNYEFIATATALVDFDKDGIFSVWTINQDGELLKKIPD